MLKHDFIHKIIVVVFIAVFVARLESGSWQIIFWLRLKKG